MQSIEGKYGFMSNTGVLSNISIPETCKTPFSIFSNFTIENPIGFGLFGLRVANMPNSYFEPGGFSLIIHDLTS